MVINDSRIMKLDFIDENFLQICKKKLILVGCGGVGSYLCYFLVKSGFENLTIIDHDKVEESNIERQNFTLEDIGKYKVDAIKELCIKTSKNSNITVIKDKLTSKNLDLLKGYDLIVDCTDNFETRDLINSFCKKNKKDWLYNGAIKGKIVSYLFDNNQNIYEMYFKNKKNEKASFSGILPVIPSMVAGLAHINILKYFYNKEIKFNKIDFWNNYFYSFEFK